MNSAILLGYVKHVWEDDCRGHFQCRSGLEFSGPDCFRIKNFRHSLTEKHQGNHVEGIKCDWEPLFIFYLLILQRVAGGAGPVPI